MPNTMSLEQQIADLTTATTNLLDAVNVRKSALDAAENNAALAAAAASQSAAEAQAAAASGTVGSLAPEAGKAPLAGEDGKIASEWVRDVVTARTGPGGGITASAGNVVLAGFVPADIAVIGDSRAVGVLNDWSVTAVSPSGVPVSGQYFQVLGAQAGAALNETGLYEYNHSTGLHRWTCGADTAGAWQQAVVGRHLLESGSPGRGLRLLLWRPLTANVSQAVTLAGFRVHHYRGWLLNRHGLMDRIETEFPGVTAKNLGAGGCRTLDCVNMLPYYARESGGAGVDVWWCGTNDIANNVSSAEMLASATAVFDARIALGRRVIIIGEHARWGVDTSTPLTELQRTIHAEYNTGLRMYAEARRGHCIFIDSLRLTADVSQTDLRPQAGVIGQPGMLFDNVHPGLGVAQSLHPRVVTAIRSFIDPAWQPSYATRGPTVVDFDGRSWFPGVGGTVTAPTTSTTGVPDNMTVNQTANVTSSWNKSGLTSEPGVAVECVYSATPGTSQYTRIVSGASSLASLGLAVGNWVQLEAIVEVDSCGEEDKFDVYATFSGPGIRATTNAAAAPGVYRVKTAPLQVPATTTTIQFRLEIWTGTTKASAGKVRFGKCVLLRVAAPPTF